MKPGVRWRDLAFALGALALLDALAALDAGGAARVVVGALAIVAAPGYLLSVALFPEAHRVVNVTSGQDEEARVRQEREGLDAVERATLSGGLGLALVALCALALAWTPAGVQEAPLLALVSAGALVAAAVALRRRMRLPAERRAPTASWLPGGLTPRTRRERLLAALALAAFASLLAAGAWLAAAPREPERFTEFYILGPGGKAEGYPSRLAPGEEASLIVGLANHEGVPVAYRVSLRMVDGAWEGEGANRTFREGNSTLLAAWDVVLDDGERLEEPRSFAAPATPGPRKLALDLRRAEDEAPYRSLHLFLDVRA